MPCFKHVPMPLKMFIAALTLAFLTLLQSAFCYHTQSHGRYDVASTGSASIETHYNRPITSGFPSHNNNYQVNMQHQNANGFDWENVRTTREDDVRPIYENQDDFFIFDQNDFYTRKPIRVSSTTTRRPWTTVKNASPVAIPGMGTTRSPCEDACQTTPQYNPVCGNDNVSYFSLGRLMCAQRCGKNVRLLHYGSCSRRVN